MKSDLTAGRAPRQAAARSLQGTQHPVERPRSADNTPDSSQEKQIERLNIKERRAVEGGFGTGKRRFGLARIMVRFLQFMVPVSSAPSAAFLDGPVGELYLHMIS